MLLKKRSCRNFRNLLKKGISEIGETYKKRLLQPCYQIAEIAESLKKRIADIADSLKKGIGGIGETYKKGIANVSETF